MNRPYKAMMRPERLDYPFRSLIMMPPRRFKSKEYFLTNKGKT